MTEAELEALAVVFIKSIVRQIDVEEMADAVGVSLNLNSREQDRLEHYLTTKRDSMEWAVTLR